MKQTNILYIVEPEDVPPYVPNFTMTGSAAFEQAMSETHEASKNFTTEAAITGVAATGAAVVGARIAAGVLAGPLLGLPAGLLISAAATSPAVARLFAKDKEQLPTELQSEERAELEQFMRRHAHSIQMAADAGFVFPPGHPQVGQVYKQHPLATVKNAGKTDVYIPADKYDELLLEEREAELLRLLVHLGATRVTITRTQKSTSSRKINGAITGSAAIGGASLEASTESSDEVSVLDVREFELAGREWKDGDRLDRSRFAWVRFEPSWDALIEAREVGGCVKAALEVRENTSFSSDRSLAINVKSKLFSGGASGGSVRDLEEETIYFVKVEFGKCKANDNA